jgi:hypothetical protein
MTEAEETLIAQQINFVEKGTHKNLVSYFKQISVIANDVTYNDQVISDLEKMGEHNEVPKAFARLLKEHKHLKVCLDNLLHIEHRLAEEHNE